MNDSLDRKINIAVLITSITQRNITIETAHYYSEICNEVILIDEEQPFLTKTDIEDLKNKGITYIKYEGGNHASALNSAYEKRLIGASISNKSYVVHSNHDERYTYQGLLACVNELDSDKKLTFCIGQAIAVRKDKSELHFSRSYEKLSKYYNFNNVNQRLYYHAAVYVPLAHYSVWRRECYINVTKDTMSIHESLPSSTMMEEVIFELAADLAGNSKAIPQLFWIRNRINPPSHNSKEQGEHVFNIIKKKLHFLLDDIDGIEIDNIVENFWNHFTFVRPSLFSKTIISAKRFLRMFIKKKKITNVSNLLHDSNINFKEDDLSNLFKSMRL